MVGKGEQNSIFLTTYASNVSEEGGSEEGVRRETGVHRIHIEGESRRGDLG